MPDLRADEIVTMRHKRSYIQENGARPGNPVAYAGQDSQYFIIEGVGNPEAGGIDPIWVHDLYRQGKYHMSGRSITAPDLPKSNLIMREKHGSLPKILLSHCPFNVYEATGACQDLSDFLGGWTDYVQIYSDGVIGDKDLGNRSQWDSDDAVEDTSSVTWGAIYPIGALGFGEGAANQVDLNVVDIVFGRASNCLGCDFGDKLAYALSQPMIASPGSLAEVIYTIDGGATWIGINITGMGVIEMGYAIDIVGSYLVVLGEDAYYYALIDQNTGVPGTFTKVSTGFVAAGSPKDMYVANPREVWFVGDAGYIYKSTDITTGVSVVNAGVATTQDLKRITGLGETLVAVGAAGTVLKSINRGVIWATTTTSPVLAPIIIQAVAVMDGRRYWVGTNGGRVYFTLDGGETWHEKAIDGSGNGQIWDIVFPTQEVGYIAHATATPVARIHTTWDGGEDWTRNPSRIMNMPVYDIPNRIACPATDDLGWISNTLAIAGLAGNGIDGIILIGTAAKL